MRSRLLLAFALIGPISLSAGCATETTTSEPAWQSYVEFEQGLEKEGLDLDFEPYFTASAYADVAEADADDLSYVKEMLAYPWYFEETFSHSEKAMPNGACLTINGRTDRGDIGSLSIEFLERNGLKMNDANLLFVDSMDELPRQGQCPQESRFRMS